MATAKSLPDHSLTKMIVDSFSCKTRSDEFSYIFSSTLGYLSGYCTAFEFQHCLKPYCVGLGFSAKDFRLRLHTTHYFSLSIKMFLFHIGLHRTVEPDTAKAITAYLSVAKCDSTNILDIWSRFPKLRSHVKSVVRQVPKEQRHLMDPETLDLYFSTIYASILKYVKFISYTKLRFIARTSNCELGDLQNDIMLKVSKSLHSLVPIRIPEAHIVNYLKRCAHNCAMNIIESETTQKRGRLVNMGLDASNQRTFSLLVMSENQMLFNPENPDATYDSLYSDDGQIDKFELEFSVSEILNRYRKTEKKYRFLCILMGTEDEEFTKFLFNLNECSEHEDNVDVQSRLPVKDFNKLLSRFLRIREKDANVFMLRIAKRLAIPMNNNKEVKYG